MPKILIVHGISNQYLGESQLLSAWYPALCDGLRRANATNLPAEADCFCPFYGSLFRKPGHMGVAAAPTLAAVAVASPNEYLLLEAVWKEAARIDPKVRGPAAFGGSLLWAPNLAIRALNALSKSSYLAGYTPLQFFGDLKQVVLYLDDPDLHDKILDKVLSHIDAETRIVIGHSLGSVIAYEAVCAKPASIETLLTVGSPLGIRNVVFDKLKPPPGAMGVGQWPGNVQYWRNIVANRDPVAAEKRLDNLFSSKVENRIIDSGLDAHSSTRYLDSLEAGEAVARSL
jgi:hypothetical protein